MAVTLKNIATELNISPSLVSQVLNGKADQYRINKETGKAVRNKATELGYIPNKIARGLVLKKTKTIALLTPDLSNPYFAKITKVIQNKLREMDYSLMIFESNDETSREIEEIQKLQSNGIDGIIIIPVGNEFGHLENLVNKNFPIVILYRTFKELRASSIKVNNYSNVFDIVSLLIDKGHKNIGLIQGKGSISTNHERFNGYCDAFKKHNLDFSKDLIIEKDFSRETGYLGTIEILKSSNRPTALITTSEFLTLGALQALSENNVKIPNDIALVGFDSLNIKSSLKVPISTVSPPKEELGELAVKLLMSDIKSKGKDKKEMIELESKLHINESGL